MGRGRLLIILAFIIVLVGVVIALVLLPQAPPPAATEMPDGVVETSIPANLTPSLTPTEINPVPLYIALFDLPRGTRITEDDVRLTEYPQNNAPFNLIDNPDDLIGKIAATDIYREQPILQTMLVDDLSQIGAPRNEASAVLPPDTVAISVPMDRLTSVAYAIRDGDRVDVIISLLFVDVDEQFQTIEPNSITIFRENDNGEIEILEGIEGRPDVSPTFGGVVVGPSEEQRPRLVTQRTVQNAFVVHIGEFPRDGIFISVPPTPTPVPPELDDTGGRQPTQAPTPVPPRPDIITLAVTPQEAVYLTWAVEARLPITFALRSSQFTGPSQTQPVTLDWIMDTYGIQLPTRRPYSIQPPIRSIRQVITADVITFGENVTPQSGSGN